MYHLGELNKLGVAVIMVQQHLFLRLGQMIDGGPELFLLFWRLQSGGGVWGLGFGDEAESFFGRPLASPRTPMVVGLVRGDAEEPGLEAAGGGGIELGDVLEHAEPSLLMQFF